MSYGPPLTGLIRMRRGEAGSMSDLVVVSNRGPLSFRLGPDGQPRAAGSGGGLASALHPLLQGSGATWVSAAMNEADRLAVDMGLMHEDGMHIVTVAPDPDTYRMAYDVIANATLWFCHHHLFDLPRRPRFDQHWQEAWKAYRTFNQLFANAVIAWRAQRRRGLGAGLSLGPLRSDVGRSPTRSAHRALQPHALWRPECFAGPTDNGGR